MKNITITREFIHSHKTEAGGWTRDQLNVLGVEWPPKKGWLSGSVGKEITEEEARRFAMKKRANGR
jgi:hypothetical protein